MKAYLKTRFHNQHLTIGPPPHFGKRLYIGLAGRAKHGKSSVARELEAYLLYHGIAVSVTAFAAVPKEMLKTMGLVDEQLYGNTKEVPDHISLGGKTARFAMQSLATEWGRNMLYDNIWVDAWANRCMDEEVSEVIIVDDVRHVPEIERIHKFGGVVLEVYRPGIMPKTALEKAVAWWKGLTAHSSERLNFSRHGCKRVLVEENNPRRTFENLLAQVPILQ